MNTPLGQFPILPLRNTIIYPGLSQVIRVGRKQSVQALKAAEKNGFWILAVQQKLSQAAGSEERAPTATDVHLIGTLCRIDSMKGSAENGFQVVLHGMARRSLEAIELKKNPDAAYLQAEALEMPDIQDVNASTSQALVASIKEIGKSILQLLPMNTEALQELLLGVTDLSYLTYLCAGNLDLGLDEKQQLLELTSLKERSLKLLTLMQDFRSGVEVQNEVRSKLNQKMGKAQRQVLLREQMKAIRDELNEGEEMSREEELQKRLDEAGLPEDVFKMANQELRRLGETGPQSPETHIIRNYLELILSLPWNKSSVQQDVNLEEAKQILDADHYGLERIKKRILQHLAVLKLRKDTKGSMLCLVGPPGVGKTSLGQSIAKALGKKFVRVSLGGVRDDAEIRGHRRTYIGAMPGRIIQGLKKAGENDPVFLLDEIDKLSRAFNGDPASALLETLDPEQNKNFLDHYLDVGFDLSKVFFIATANSLDSIPGPLLDRMEVIELSGYTASEKLHIAKNHLLPKVLSELGMKPEQIQFSDPCLMRLINSYTREAGVRELQRKITAVLRAKAQDVLVAKEFPLAVSLLELEEILGQERHSPEMALTKPQVGVVTGLAWTPVGGDILLIESTQSPGKGQILLTGQLGDVMKESAQIAMTLSKSLVPDFAAEQRDLHVHLPSGAIPKDGPSAGVTLLTSLVSQMTGIPVPVGLAMTGEITLRGAVLPVGGIKEKLLAAHRAGIKKILLPEKNEKDLKEIPEEVKAELEIHLVQDINQLLKLALNYQAPAKAHPMALENLQTKIAPSTGIN